MLNIRDEHWKAFEDDVEARYVAKITKTMMKVWPATCSRLEEPLREVVAGCVQRGKSHGWETQGELSRFLHLSFMVGPGFDLEKPWARKILGWKVTLKKKLDALERAAQEELVAEQMKEV